ncbi:hypothetical protein [Leptolyngbya sp. FACHB-261]|uniref:hypothetical protein n=1 Tax=Leptolyngbya sp. FACHB-261 TaxID=2692806 RepID=UPI001684ADE4|nr:hypothetical protein [Leptolyngbya sp. FACHB-261]MBD2101758.1 hypothetical protein [Leptolyngbya sp. FACHB-261]
MLEITLVTTTAQAAQATGIDQTFAELYRMLEELEQQVKQCSLSNSAQLSSKLHSVAAEARQEP